MHGISYVNAQSFISLKRKLCRPTKYIDLYDLHNDKSHDYHEHYIVRFIIIFHFLWNSYDFYYHEIR